MMPQKHTAYLEEQQHHEELAHIVELPLEPTTLWSKETSSAIHQLLTVIEPDDKQAFASSKQCKAKIRLNLVLGHCQGNKFHEFPELHEKEKNPPSTLPNRTN